MTKRRNSETTLRSINHSEVPHSLSHWQLLGLRGTVTQDILAEKYDGSGTKSDPYIVSFVDNDPGDPKQLSIRRKWTIVAMISLVSFIAAFGSSVYSGALNEIEQHFRVNEEVTILGLSLYVLGLAVGPLIWAPMGEVIGRQATFFISFGGYTFFNLGTTLAQNIQTLIVLRFFAGAFASAPFTNASGVLADIFDPAERGMAFGFYAITPFMGPILGPTVGGFLGSAAGWRWVLGLLTIVSGVCWLLGTVLVPETFGQVLLQRRANMMSKITGDHYISSLEVLHGRKPPGEVFKTALTRPWAILFLEPIVFLLSTWISTLYGTLYLFIAGFPFVYEIARGWSPGVSGLAFFGIGVGTILAAVFNIFTSKRFAAKAKQGGAQPEIRLQPAMFGGLFIPVGLFWFAWTNSASIPWIVSVMAGSFFGFGMVIVWTSVNNYLVDAYKVYAASALAGQVVWRSLFGAIFPLFTSYMYRGLGLHWASSVPAFIALALAPLPFVFYRYGSQIRKKSRFASQADATVKAMEEKRGSV